MGTEDEKTEQISGGEVKAREYANRVVDEGEDYNSIIQGLGPTMISSINAAIERRGYEVPAEQRTQILDGVEGDQDTSSGVPEPIATYVAKVTENRSEAVQDLYKGFLENIKDKKQRDLLIQALFGDTYRNFRTVDYGIDPKEELTWEYAQGKQGDGIRVKESDDWMYRGIMPGRDEETITRGSFNVTVTPEFIDALDSYITSGKIKANYKFGKPDTGASPQERHDSISIYFLEQPNEEVLDELSEMVRPYVRGNDLLGEKVADGFYLSEIGSVQDEHIGHLVEMLDGVDPAFGDAVKTYVTSRGGRIAMSEAQYYSIKQVAEVFGYNLSYKTESGFDVSLRTVVERQANYEGDESLLLFERLDNKKIREQIIQMWMAGYNAREGEMEQRPKQDENGNVIFNEDGSYIWEDVPFVPPTEKETREEIARLIEEVKIVTPISFDERPPSFDNTGIDRIGIFWKMPDGTKPTLKQKTIMLAHEKGHAVRQFPGTEQYYSEIFKKALDTSRVTYTQEDYEQDVNQLRRVQEGEGHTPDDEYYSFENVELKIRDYLARPEEIVERMAQLKNYFGFKGDEEFTQEHLDYARARYVKDTGMDNHMRHFFESITNDQEFLRLINSVGV